VSTAVWEARRRPVASTAVLLTAIAVIAVGAVSAAPLMALGLVLIFATVFALGHRWLLRWDVLAGLLIVIVLVVPIRRFVLPGGLPFQLEPYRVYVALLVAAWGSSLLIDPRVRLRRTGFEAPLLLFFGAAVASVLVNLGYVSDGARVIDPTTKLIVSGSLEGNVVKAITFFVSFVLVFYFIASVVRTREAVDRLLKLLVAGGAVVAVFSIVESRTGVNVFDRLPRVLPFLQENFLQEVPNRGARLRARGPAEHAIALSAVLAMLVPLGVYLAVTRRHAGWWLATAVTALGALAAVSRTGVVMLLVVGIVFFAFRPRSLKRAWPALIPLVVAVHFAMPGTLGTLRQAFAPPGGLLAEQRYESGGGQVGGGRLADIAPTLEEWWERPTLGHGFGTRVVAYDPGTGQVPNAIILDNQWLATLLETGLVGFFALAWLFVRSTRRLLVTARRDPSPRGWLFAALAASIASVAVGMLFFDALSFVQVALVLFIVFALAAVALRATAPRSHLTGV
jgi:polysaccharide biosynthesis protein PslJ